MSDPITEHDLSRMCTLLQSENKLQRRRMLEEIFNNASAKEQSWTAEELLKVWDGINRPLVRLLSDQTEICRDYTVEILKKFMEILPVHEKNIIYIVPIMSKRLSSQEYIEQSEEVRLKCITLLRIIISKYKEFLPAYIDDLIAILAKCVADNYPNVKKESCEAISLLAKTLPKHFYNHSESLIKPTMSNFTHQHYKVRAISVKTIGDIMQYGNSKTMDEVATPLAERLFDQSGIVREAVIDVAGSWLINLKDRYSWWHKILPLLMTGLHDEIENIRIKAAKLWDTAGLQYIQENMEDEKFKDKMDFLSEKLDHYPPDVSRPNLGCRTIAQQHFCKLVGGIGSELRDWKPDIRVRSAQLLCVFVLNIEQDVTQHIEKLLPPMYCACNDDDERVAENVEIAAKYLGYFVNPDIYCELVIPTLEESPTAGHLRVFSNIIRGSDRKLLLPQIKRIANFLQQPHICRSKKDKYQKQILSCCDSLLIVCEKDCSLVLQDLYNIIFTTLSMAADMIIQKESNRLLDSLVRIQSLSNTEELHLYCIRPLLELIQHNCEAWTVYNAESHIFWASLTYAGIAISLHMNLIFPILEQTMSTDADPELRLKHFILLSEYFLSCKKWINNISNLCDFVDNILKSCIMPGLIWSAGRAAEAIRTAAVCCLCALLENDTNSTFNNSTENEDNPDIKSDNKDHFDICLFSTVESFSSIFEKMIPVLITLSDDNAKKTRLYSLRAICMITRIGKRLSCVMEEHIHKTYPIVLKKLDDGCDQVRVAAIEALVEIWKCIPKMYNLEFNRSHIDGLYTTAIIHLDDPESKFQDLMLDALKNLAKIHPELLFQKLQNCRSNFRNQSGIDELLKHCQDILINS